MLFGKWTGFVNDSTYYEIWANDSLFLTWNELGWSYDVVPYRLDKKDSLITTSIDNFHSFYYTIKINELTDNYLEIRNDFGEWSFEKISNESPLIEQNNEQIWEEIGNRNKINQLISQIQKQENVKVQIDSINSGISANLKEIKELRDSIEVDFDGYFHDIPVTLIHNGNNLFQDTLETDESIGFSTDIKFNRGRKKNTFILLLKGKKYEFVENNKYNFIHISDTRDGFSIVYTNKGYVHD
jgi:hypothetical protein